MKFGLEQHIIDKLIAVFEQHSKVDKALVFGSRAKGNYRPDSDIDIAIKGQELTTDDIIAMSVAFEENGITHKIDLINYHSIKEPDLKDHIDRVGIELYSKWKECKLGDVTKLITKGTTPSSLGGKFINKGINYIKSEAVSYDGKIDKSTFVFIDEAVHQKLKRSQLAKDDILYSMAGIYLGKNGLVTEDMLPANTNQALAIIRLNQEKAKPKFIHYYLRQKSVIDFVNNMSGQSAQPNINFEEIKSIDILLPPLQEQTAIATILSSLDDKIDLLHRQNKTLEQLAETLFRQWFVEEAEESWEEKSLPEITDYLNGLALQKFPAKIDYLPVIKIREMKQGISENSDKCSRDIPLQYIVQDGDVLFSWSGSLEVVFWTGGEGALNQHLFKVSSKKYPKWFYYLATKHHLPEFKVIAESKSTTMGHIQRVHLQQAMISIPPKELFDQYNERITPMIDKLIDNHKQIRTLTQIRNTLLPKLMNGEVRVDL
ncbi:hypothetical protein A5893_08320 [Pedobacter psychrophilus]|uniref:Restriction endonuclease subunit S n=1 Tax=Pedobacter psychrophilus TaxID=1826909 RepID=A0A179DF37_9SPHI|nr:restriction endonuclease subunit S [Pedobacter psychrophilus]OAQ39588.1 hypothetical protein A5893_08320 [Pedobacter psychrophilus]